MAARTVPVLKFVGTITLGLLTGHSLTLSTLSLPALLTFPTATHAHSTYTTLSNGSARFASTLRHVTSAALVGAYVLSGRRGRHPYLLYAALVAAGSGAGVDFAFELTQTAGERGRGQIKSAEGEGLFGEGTVGKEGEEVNGEEVRKSVERAERMEAVRAGVVGVAFAVAVVGIWGDGV